MFDDIGHIFCIVALITSLLSWSNNPKIQGLVLALAFFFGGMVITVLLGSLK